MNYKIYKIISPKLIFRISESEFSSFGLLRFLLTFKIFGLGLIAVQMDFWNFRAWPYCLGNRLGLLAVHQWIGFIRKKVFLNQAAHTWLLRELVFASKLFILIRRRLLDSGLLLNIFMWIDQILFIIKSIEELLYIYFLLRLIFSKDPV